MRKLGGEEMDVCKGGEESERKGGRIGGFRCYGGF